MEEKIKRHRRTKAEMLALASHDSAPALESVTNEFNERHKKTGRGRPSKSEMDYKLDDPNRPKISCDKDAVDCGIKPKIYQHEFPAGKDGVKSIWYYDWNINKVNGLVRTENIFPKDFDDTLPDDDSLPLTKRTFLNPANGKYVGYGRAVQLGLYKPEAGSGKRGRPKKA